MTGGGKVAREAYPVTVQRSLRRPVKVPDALGVLIEFPGKTDVNIALGRRTGRLIPRSCVMRPHVQRPTAPHVDMSNISLDS